MQRHVRLQAERTLTSIVSTKPERTATRLSRISSSFRSSSASLSPIFTRMETDCGGGGTALFQRPQSFANGSKKYSETCRETVSWGPPPAASNGTGRGSGCSAPAPPLAAAALPPAQNRLARPRPGTQRLFQSLHLVVVLLKSEERPACRHAHLRATDFHECELSCRLAQRGGELGVLLQVRLRQVDLRRETSEVSGLESLVAQAATTTPQHPQHPTTTPRGVITPGGRRHAPIAPAALTKR